MSSDKNWFNENLFSYWIYHRERIQITQPTKAQQKKGQTGHYETKYKKVNRKSYKNIHWMNKMYDKKVNEQGMVNIFKVILPEYFPVGFKLYKKVRNKKEPIHYATVVYNDPENVLMTVREERTGEHELYWKDYCIRNYIKTAAGDFRDGLVIREEHINEALGIGSS